MDPARPTSTPSAVAAPADSEAAMLNHQARANVSSRAGYFRWVICALLLLGTTKNYMDRWVISALKTTLQHDLGWNEINYSDLVFAFQAAYAVGMLVVGRLIDRLGTRLGYAIVMVFWSLASMAHALGSSFSSFLMARSALGFGGLALWLLLYQRPEDHPRCSKAELEYILGDTPQPVQKIKWSQLFPYRQTWAFACGKFLIDPIWWFYLFWVPDFLERQHGLHLAQIGLPIVVIYLISDVGSVTGGWLSSFLIRRGVSVNASRKIAMLL